MKKVIKELLLVILVFLFLKSVPSIAYAQNKCTASDESSLSMCFEKANNNQTEEIEINTLIRCDKIGSCNFSLSNRTAPLIIHGTPNSGAGIRRSVDYSHGIFLIQGVRNLTISDLVFDETDTSCDVNIANNCTYTVAIIGSNNILIDHVFLYGAKFIGFEFGSTSNLIIKNSTMVNCGFQCIWMDRADTSPVVPGNFTQASPVDQNRINKFVTIENNFFHDTKTAAVNFAAFGTPDKPNLIRNNLIVHNHRDSIFHVCGPDSQSACPGGQFVLERSENIIFENNVVKDGKIDLYDYLGLYTTGIETSDHLKNITIRNNDIHNNRGSAIFADYSGAAFQTENINIINNKVYGNGWGINFPGANIDNNCESEINCQPILPMAKFYAYPNPCIMESGKDLCETKIIWKSNDTTDIKIKVGDSVFAAAPEGSQIAPWINKTGGYFDLYLNGQLADRLFVRGIAPLNVSITPATISKTGSYSLTTNNSYNGYLEVKYSIYPPGGTTTISGVEKWCYNANECLLVQNGSATVNYTGRTSPIGRVVLQFRPFGSNGPWSNSVELNIMDKITIASLRSFLQNFTNIFDFNRLISNFGK